MGDRGGGEPGLDAAFRHWAALAARQAQASVDLGFWESSGTVETPKNIKWQLPLRHALRLRIHAFAPRRASQRRGHADCKAMAAPIP